MKKIIMLLILGLMSFKIAESYTEMRSDGSYRPVSSSNQTTFYIRAGGGLDVAYDGLTSRGIAINNNTTNTNAFVIDTVTSKFYKIANSTDSGAELIGYTKASGVSGLGVKSKPLMDVYTLLTTTASQNLQWGVCWASYTIVGIAYKTKTGGYFLMEKWTATSFEDGVLDYTEYSPIYGIKTTGCAFQSTLLSAATIPLTDNSGNLVEYNTFQQLAKRTNSDGTYNYYAGVTESNSSSGGNYIYLGSYLQYDDFTNPEKNPTTTTKYVFVNPDNDYSKTYFEQTLQNQINYTASTASTTNTATASTNAITLCTSV